MTAKSESPSVGAGAGAGNDAGALVSYPNHNKFDPACQPPSRDNGGGPPLTAADIAFIARDTLADEGLLIQDASGLQILDAMTRLVSVLEGVGERPAPALPGVLEPHVKPLAVPPGLPLSDLGNAERLMHRHGQDLRYCHAWRSWLVWDGVRWREDQTGEVDRRAVETVRNIYQEVADEPDEKTRQLLATHALRSEAGSKRREMVTTAQALLPITPAELDADPWLLNVANGTLDLRSGTLLPHRRADLITKLAPVHYDPNASLDLWDRFLATATASNAELVAFLQRATGYTLTGNTGEEVLLFVHGPAATGKSTFLEAIKATLGDYAKTADFDTFLKRSFSEGGRPRPEIADLAGARLVASLEVDEGKRLAEGLIKMITGGDTVRARKLYRESFEFVPMFKLWLAANHAPKINPDDGAMWRRILRVPFEAVIPEVDRDPHVKATLRDPATAGPAILAWAVRGALAWQIDGLGTCPAVTTATAELRAEMDPLRDFLTACCILKPTAWTPTAALRGEYEAWCKEVGERPISGREFTQSLQSNGCKPDRDRVGGVQKRGWRGVGLLGGDDDPLADTPMDSAPGCDTVTLQDSKNDKTTLYVGDIQRLSENSVTSRHTVTNTSPSGALCTYWESKHRRYWLRDGVPVCAVCRPPAPGVDVWDLDSDQPDPAPARGWPGGVK